MKKTIKKTKPAKPDLDRSSAEQSLRNSELRYRRLFEAAQDGILILDAKTGAITDVNPYLIDKLGYSREEFIEKKLWQVGAFKDIEASKDAFEALQKNAYIRYKDLPLRAKDGRLLPVEFVSNVYPENHHNVIQCNIRDITERKQAEPALLESDQRFRSLIENASDLVLILNPDYTIAYVSPSVERILGYTVAGVTGAKITDFVDPQDLPDLIAATEHRIQTPGSSPSLMQLRVRHANGSWHTLEGIGSNLRDQPGVSGLVINARDITERKRAEEALLESELKFRTLFDCALDGILIADMETRRFFMGNSAICQMLGYTHNELLSIGIDEIHPLEHLPYVVEQFNRQARGEINLSEDIPVRRKDCSVFYADINSTPVTLGGHTYMMGVFRDITARKQVEQALRESEERFSKVFHASPAAISVTTLAEGRFVEVNDSFLRLLGEPSRKEVIGRSVLELGAAVSSEYRASLAQALRAHGRVSNVEAQFDTLTSEKRDVLASLELIELNGQACILTLALDITERKRAEVALQASEARYRAVAQTARDAIISADHAGNIVGWNQGAERVFGYTEAEAIGRALILLVPPQYGGQHLAGFQRIQAEGNPHVIGKTVELSGLRKDGSEFPLELALSEWQVAEGKFYTGIIRDITERKQVEEKLKELSTHNALTGLYNRGFFEEEMTRLGRGRQFPVSVVMADLNDLKETNDRDGHAAGDALLQRAAQVFNAAFRAADIIARVGGDEFAVLLPDTDAASAQQSLRRVRHALDEHNAAHGGARLSIAFGVSTAEQGGKLTDTLKEADARMYEEKRGR